MRARNDAVDGAADFAEKVLTADSGDARAHFALGRRDLLQKNYVQTESHLLKSLDRNPDEPAALNNLAKMKIKATPSVC